MKHKIGYCPRCGEQSVYETDKGVKCSVCGQIIEEPEEAYE